MQKRGLGTVLVVGYLLAGCGVNGGADSKVVARQTPLSPPAQVSADFALDQEVAPEFNPNATLLGVAASTSAGYLLGYTVPYAPELWSRPALYLADGSPYQANDLVLLHWGAASGAPSVLAKLPSLPSGSLYANARVLDVGSRWLVVYEVWAENVTTRYSVTLARDGSLGSPTALPGTCATGMSGFVRATATALLTDACGNGILLDFAGQVVKTFTVATPDAFPNWTGGGSVSGGQLAFNGIDYLALYAYPSETLPKYVMGFPVSPAGTAATPIVISPSAVPYASVYPLSLAANGSTFFSVVAQGRSSGPGTAVAYRTISETSGHVFSVSDERYPPGESIIGFSDPSDRNATALALGSSFGIVRELSTGDLELVTPSGNTDPDAVSPLLSALANAPQAIVSSDDPASGGTSFVIAAGARAVRFDAAAHAIDNPASALLSSLRGQFGPSLAFDGQSYLAAWAEGATSPKIFSHRLSTTGALLGAASVRLSPAADTALEPLATATPSLFAVAWNGRIMGFTGAATVTSADPPLVTPSDSLTLQAFDFGVASDGTQAAAAWIDSSVHITKFEGAGTWSAKLTIASNVASRPSAPALAFNGGEFAVLWTTPGNTDQRVLLGSRVSDDLTLLDATPKELLRFSSPAFNGKPTDCGVEVIAAGDHFLVAWAQIASGNEEVRIARLSSTLAVLDPGGVLVATQPYTAIGTTTHRVALGWDGTNVWVAWRDGEGSARRPFASLRGRRFSDTLTPIDSDSWLISSDLDEFSKVTLASAPGGSSMVGYTRYLASDGSFRARGRLLSASLFGDGVPCLRADQCQNGACTAGYCATATGAGGESGAGGDVGAGGEIGAAGEVGTGGVAGSSGATGLAGMGAAGGGGGVSAGGRGGNGGVAGHDGSGGAGGHAGAAGGAGGTGGSPGSDSCSCRVAGGDPARLNLSALIGFALLGVSLRRRRSRRENSLN
jgi:MYXO-CTERM domain-containing protein